MITLFVVVALIGFCVVAWLWIEPDTQPAPSRVVSIRCLPPKMVEQDWRVDVRELNDALTYGGLGLTAQQKEDWPEVIAELEKRKRENPKGFETLAQRRARAKYGLGE